MRGRPWRLAVPHRKGAGMPGCLAIHATLTAGQFSVHDGHTFWDVKSKQRIRYLGIHWPVSERKLNSDSSRIANEHPHQNAAIGVDLKENRFAVQSSLGWRVSQGSFRGFRCRTAQLAEEHGVFRVLRPFIDRRHDAFTDS